MSIADSIHRAVHNYPGGAEPLAIRMGLKGQTLRNMADPNQLSHGWSLRRFDELVAFAGTEPLQALCEKHGGMFVPLGTLRAKGTSQLLKSMMQMVAEFGDVPREIEEALKDDGRINANELERIDRQAMELVQAVSVVMQRVRELHETRAVLPEEDRP